MNNIEKTLKYHELLMVLNNLNRIKKYELPEGYHFEFWQNNADTNDWLNIHISTGEFNWPELSLQYFNDFYKDFIDELNKRCFFIVENSSNKKIATATISPCKEYGYNCVIDWFAVSKEHQGKGLAKPLLYKTIEIAKELKYNEILLHTQTHTWVAANLYLKFGFEPFQIEKDLKGWQILKTLTDNEKLQNINTLSNSEMFDPLIINIVKELDKKHENYTYSVWYINELKDVYVHQNNSFFHYKFFDNGNKLKLIEKVII